MLKCAKYNKSSRQSLPSPTYQQVRNKKVLRFAKYVLISVPDSLYQFQHFTTLLTKTGLTLQVPASTYKVSLLISIHFLKKLVLREFDKLSWSILPLVIILLICIKLFSWRCMNNINVGRRLLSVALGT